MTRATLPQGQKLARGDISPRVPNGIRPVIAFPRLCDDAALTTSVALRRRSYCTLSPVCRSTETADTRADF